MTYSKPSVKKKRDHGELSLQIAFTNWAEHALPGVLFFAVPNGGARSIIEATLLKRQGVKRGVADLIIAYASGFHALELKNPNGKGILSESQNIFAAQWIIQGGKYACCKNGEEIMAALDQWGIPYKFPFPIIGPHNKKMVRHNAYHQAMMEIAHDD